jgi:hypothetical protein
LRVRIPGLFYVRTGRKPPALDTLSLAFSAEETVSKPGRQDATLQVVLAVVGSVVEKDVANSTRLMDEDDMSNRQAADHDRLLKVLARKAL